MITEEQSDVVAFLASPSIHSGAMPAMRIKPDCRVSRRKRHLVQNKTIQSPRRN
jgi:hypothetical protein